MKGATTTTTKTTGKHIPMQSTHITQETRWLCNQSFWHCQNKWNIAKRVETECGLLVVIAGAWCCCCRRCCRSSFSVSCKFRFGTTKVLYAEHLKVVYTSGTHQKSFSFYQFLCFIFLLGLNCMWCMTYHKYQIFPTTTIYRWPKLYFSRFFRHLHYVLL